jgi:hypothetical protein
LAGEVDVDFGIAAPAIGAHELHQIRGGAVPKVKEIVVVGLRPGDGVASVVPELSNIVVLAGVPEAASGIHEALVTTAAGVRETAFGFGDGVRGRIPGIIANARQTVRPQDL